MSGHHWRSLSFSRLTEGVFSRLFGQTQYNNLFYGIVDEKIRSSSEEKLTRRRSASHSDSAVAAETKSIIKSDLDKNVTSTPKVKSKIYISVMSYFILKSKF